MSVLIISDYIRKAMELAEYDKLDDGSFSGKIHQCTGVIAFSNSLRECETELQSVLEDWLLLGIKLGHKLPVIQDIDLNWKPDEQMVSV